VPIEMTASLRVAQKGLVGVRISARLSAFRDTVKSTTPCHLFLRQLATHQPRRGRQKKQSDLALDSSLADIAEHQKECLDPLDDVFGFESFSQQGLRVPVKSAILLELEAEEREQAKSLESQAVMQDDYFDDEDEVVSTEFQVPHPDTYFVADMADTSSRDNLGHYFELKEFPEGTPGHLEEEFQASQKRHLMIRKPACDYIASLEAFENGNLQEGPRPITVLKGDRGTGKSATVAHVVQWCRDRDWIVVFAKDTMQWATKQGSVEPSEIRLRPLSYDQPEYSMALLQQCLEAHGDQLADLPVTTAAAGSCTATNLRELVEQGITEDADGSAPDPDGAVIRLLEELSTVTDRKVLIAIDDFNWLYEPVPYTYNLSEILYDDDEPVKLKSAVREHLEARGGVDMDEVLDRNNFYFGNTKLEAQEMTLMNQFRYFCPSAAETLRPPPVNGFVLAAYGAHSIDPTPVSRQLRKTCDAKEYEINMPSAYSSAELRACMDWYAATDWLVREPTDELLSYCHLRWGSNPEAIRKAAMLPYPKEM